MTLNLRLRNKFSIYSELTVLKYSMLLGKNVRSDGKGRMIIR